MSKAKALVEYADFNRHAVAIVDQKGERWAVANSVADALGARERSFRSTINNMRNSKELTEGRHFIYLPLPSSGGTQKTLCLSHYGVIRAMMRVNAPRANEFRDWAEDVLHKVMTTGSYGMVPALPDDFKVTTDVMLNKLNKLNATINTLAKEEQTWEATARREQYNWMTAAQFIQEEYDAYKDFNRYGRFDKFAAERFEAIYGRPPRIRRPALFSKEVTEEYVYPRDHEHREFMRTLYRIWRNVHKASGRNTKSKRKETKQRKGRRPRRRHRMRAAEKRNGR